MILKPSVNVILIYMYVSYLWTTVSDFSVKLLV